MIKVVIIIKIRHLVLYPAELWAQLDINLTYDLLNKILILFILIY